MGMRIVAPILIAALAACSDPSAPVLGFERQPIVGGALTVAGQFPTVVAVFETKAGALCTGTLISPTVVLTAAHCIDSAELGRTPSEIVAEMEVIFDSLNADNAAPANIVHATQIFENPSHPNFAQPMPDLGHDDDALIVLDTPQTTRPTSPVDLTAANLLGVTTTQVGYGINNIGTGHAGIEFYLTGKSIVSCGLAGPNMLDANLICFNEMGGKGQCNGDSGGPAFDPLGHIIGVVSFGDTTCSQFGADTRPTQTANFILANVPELAAGVCGMDGVCNLSCATDPDCVPLAPYCGDGVMQAGEQCDAGSDNGRIGSGCATDCTPVAPVCGNSIIEMGEACDLGAANGTEGVTCSADCQIVQEQDSPSSGGGCCSTSTGSPVELVGFLLVLGFVIRRRSR